MNFMTKDTDLNGEFSDRKGSLNGQKRRRAQSPPAALILTPFALAKPTSKQQALRSF
jgi:hypothetical protein